MHSQNKNNKEERKQEKQSEHTQFRSAQKTHSQRRNHNKITIHLIITKARLDS